MDMQDKRHHGRYVPWFSSDDDLFDPEEGEEDNWISYIHRGLHQRAGEEVPFEDSSWTYKSDTSPFLSDVELHDHVLDLLYQNENVDASKIIVMVLNGVVELNGKVISELHKSAAEKIVRSISSVWAVNNNLTVLPETKAFGH